MLLLLVFLSATSSSSTFALALPPKVDLFPPRAPCRLTEVLSVAHFMEVGAAEAAGLWADQLDYDQEAVFEYVV